jgi:uncharacterized membrane protein
MKCSNCTDVETIHGKRQGADVVYCPRCQTTWQAADAGPEADGARSNVVTFGNPTARDGWLLLRPNFAMPWFAAMLYCALFVVPAITAAVLWGSFGVWAVLPFSLVTTGCVVIGLWVGYRRTRVRETVSISGESVTIETGHDRPESHFDFQHGQIEVVLEGPQFDRQFGRLLLKSSGQQVELGAFMDQEERGNLARRLALLFARTGTLEHAPA